MSDHTIMLIEDDAVIARDLKDTLGELGYRVVGIAATSEDALALAARARPDVALVDIRIKGPKDGIDTADELFKRFRVPVVFLSAYVDDVTVARARRVTPFGYLVKPFRAMEVRTSIEVAIYRARMEQALAERQHWLEATLASLDDAVVCSDARGVVKLMNRAAERLTGWTNASALGQPTAHVVQLALPAADHDGLQDGAEGTRIVRRRGGGETVVALRQTAIDGGGRELGTVLVLRDLSDEMRLRAQCEFLERMAALGTLAGSIAHNVNNPLSVILGNIDLIVSSEGEPIDPRTALEMLADARDAAIRIRSIVADLRTLWQPPDFGPRDVASVDRTIDWALEVTSHETRHFARVESEVERGMTVGLGQVRLGHVLINLLRNAAQAIGPSRRGLVRIEARRDGARAIIRVQDSGPGIPEEVRARLFEPFFTTRAKDNGMGLGLYVGRSIVATVGGTLHVETELDVGTTFVVSLPLMTGAEAPASAPKPPERKLKRSRILLVDDDPATIMALKRVLERQHEVVTADGGQAAMERLAADQRFDLVLLDLMMPDMPGDEVREEIMRRHPDLEPKVVLITAGAISRAAKDLVTNLGERVLRKPMSASELLAAVGRFLTGNQDN